MTLATMPLTAATGAPVTDTHTAASDARGPVPGAPATVSTTQQKRSENAMRALTVVALAGGAVLAGIGFAGSYSALARLGSEHGFGDFARVFPIGLDAGIVVLLALDLMLIRKGTPWPVLRLLAHGFTAATIVFNANSGAQPPAEDPIGAAMHGVIPVMFVAAVEAGRRLVIRIADIQAGREPSDIPFHRWLLAPWPTWRMYRRMRLWNVTSYAEVVALEQDRKVYAVMLEREHGSVRNAPSDARLPLTMARYGLTVTEALALPEKHARREQERQEAEAARLLAEQQHADQMTVQAEIGRLKNASAVEAARHEAAAEAGAAQARARAALTAAERAAVAEEEAVESAAAAEARARQAAAELSAAEDRKRAAETNRGAAETERAAAETKRRALETAAAAAAAQARKDAAERSAAEDRERAAEARRRAAETERAALEAEDAAALKPTERAARKVARMILATGTTDPEAVELAAIAHALGVSVSTASERRREAADLIAAGYRPDTH